MLIEILVKDNVANFKRGEIVEIEDGILLRALLKGGKAEVINPPDWEPDQIYLPFTLPEEDSDGKSNSEQTSDGEHSQKHESSSRRPRQKSPKSSEESTGTSSEGYGGLRPVAESGEDN